MRRITALVASLGLVLGLAPATIAAPSTDGTWIVTLRADADPHASARSLLRAHGGELRFVYEHAINGFAFRGSSAAASAIERNPHVAHVEADADVHLETTQTDPTWGLDRIDERSLPLDAAYNYGATGAGVTAYVIDSGIRTSHSEFDGRATATADSDFIGDGQDGQDCNGHGTHVAGTIGGEEYGVAKEVNLVSVRVFGCTGGSSWSTIIAGINWVIGHHGTGAAVANMSLSGPTSSSVDTAVRNLISDGVATAIAAGNGDWLGRQANACNYSPARVAEAMTISATDKTDKKASWANYGSCVDWFSPGVSIVSAGISGDTATATKSGTSMATPHTAGVAALYLDVNESASPQQVRDAIFAETTKDIVTSSSTTNNDLLYSGFIAADDGGGAPDEPPTVSITSPTPGSTVSGTVSVTASATDDGGVTQVEFFVDGTPVGTDTAESGGWSVAWDTTVSPNGTHDVTARATDTGSQSTTSAVVSVTVSNVATSGSMSTTLSAATVNDGSSWTAEVTVTVRDAANSPVSGATVEWTWSDGASGSHSCTTTATGECTDTRTQRKRVGSVTFTVDAVSHPSLQWTGNAQSVTIPKP